MEGPNSNKLHYIHAAPAQLRETEGSIWKDCYHEWHRQSMGKNMLGGGGGGRGQPDTTMLNDMLQPSGGTLNCASSIVNERRAPEI